MTKFLIFIIASFFCIHAQSSAVFVEQYYEYEEEPFMISYLWGVSGGILLAATINEDKGGNKLFCMPKDAVITNEESVAILEGELYGDNGAKNYADDTPISLVYLIALEKKYPCSN